MKIGILTKKISFLIIIFILFTLAAVIGFVTYDAPVAYADDTEPPTSEPAIDFDIMIYQTVTTGAQTISSGTMTYGSTMRLTLIADYKGANPADDFIGVKIEWFKTVGTEPGQTLDLISEDVNEIVLYNVVESGIYTCRVTVQKSGTDGIITTTKEDVKTATINPYTPSVSWSSTTLTFNGSPQRPNPSVILNNGQSLASDKMHITGEQTNAGEGYVATVTSLDTNYNLNASITFRINALSVSIVWDNQNRFIYNGNVQAPNATATGVGGIALDVVVSAIGMDYRAEPYVARASISDKNYSITSDSESKIYYIDQRQVDVVWSNTTLIYNGQKQEPTATANDINGVNIARVNTAVGGGINATDEGYVANALTDNTNYILSNNVITYMILKRPVDIFWSMQTSPTTIINIELENRTNWPREDRPTYNAANQISTIFARYIGADGEHYNLSRSIISGGTELKNAGAYVILAQMPVTHTNYRISEESVTTISLIIEKAKPTINIADDNPIFLYSGEAFWIDATPSANVIINYKVNDVIAPNSFIEPGRYKVVLVTEESSNYLPSDQYVVFVTINAITFTAVDWSAEITFLKGADPDTVMSIREVDTSLITNMQTSWLRNVNVAYEINLIINSEKLDINSEAEVTFYLPMEYMALEKVRIVTMKDGKYVEQIVDNIDGYITFKLYENGIYAISTINEEGLNTWWIIMGSAALGLTMLGLLLTYLRRKIDEK